MKIDFTVTTTFITWTLVTRVSDGFTNYYKNREIRTPIIFHSIPNDKDKKFIEWMEKDCLDEVEYPGRTLVIQGQIPSYVLGGTYVKNGPGAFKTKTGKRRYTHAFDGLAKLIKFTFYKSESGKIGVLFMTKFIDSLVRKCLLDWDWMIPSVTTGPVIPSWTSWEGLMASLLSVPLFDNTPVNVERISSTRTFAAVTDAPVTVSFDIHTLKTFGKVRYPGGIQGLKGLPLFSTAHSKVGIDGLTYNYFLELAPNGLFYANLVRTNQDFTQTSIGKVSTEGKICYVHDISLTQKYAIIVLYPLTADPTRLANGSGFLPQLQFNSSSPATIHVFSLNIGSMEPIATFETQAFFAYHHVNAYDDSNSIVLDILAYENGDIANNLHGFLYMDNMNNKDDRIKQVREANVWRFHLPMNSPNNRFVIPKKTSFTLLDPDGDNFSFGFELATVSPRVQGRYYRYCYGFSGHYKGSEDFLDWAIVKQDVQTGEGNAVWYEEYAYPGEPIFVPDPESPKEDGGVLLSSVYDSQRRENYLLVLNAETMKEVARAYTGTSMYG